MSSGKRYSGSTEAEFIAWSENFSANCTSTGTVYGLTQDEITTLATAVGVFKSAYEICQTPGRSKLDTITKNKAKNTLHTLEHGYVARLQVHPAMTDEVRKRYGIPIHDRNHTLQQDPTDHVDFTIEIDAAAHLVRCPYRIANSTHRGKGAYHGVEIRYTIQSITEPAPLDPDEFTRSEINTASPWEHTFQGRDAGKHAYFTMRWETNTGRKGPWSRIQSIVIP
ncbi:MAG: hypothetical protein LBD79_01710 [Treponema sp.]|jgi:hypothetical protein|nr:hypothetical protein [Treponema sp.]